MEKTYIGLDVIYTVLFMVNLRIILVLSVVLSKSIITFTIESVYQNSYLTIKSFEYKLLFLPNNNFS